MSLPPRIQFPVNVYVDRADVDIEVQNESVAIEVHDFEANAEVTLDPSDLQEFADTDLVWLVSQCALELERREKEDK
jgi:hypothetical protein